MLFTHLPFLHTSESNSLHSSTSGGRQNVSKTAQRAETVMSVYVCVCVCVFVCASMCVCVYGKCGYSVCMSVCLCMPVCIFAWVFCVRVSVSVCVCVCV